MLQLDPVVFSSWFVGGRLCSNILLPEQEGVEHFRSVTARTLRVSFQITPPCKSKEIMRDLAFDNV